MKPLSQPFWPILLLVLSIAGTALAQSFVWPPTRDGAGGQPKTAPARPAINRQPVADPVTQPTATPAAGRPLPAAPVAQASGGQVDWHVLENPNGPHTALFFDPVRQVFAVYHVDSGSGQIMLKSVRSLSADLRLDQFNSSNPAPKDIQSMLDEAR